jgi:hypothetical protein
MDIRLHPHQIEIFEDKSRYKVCAAGRRFGKSYLAAVTLFVEGSITHKVRSDGVEVDLSLEEIYYIAPTFEQGKKILWPLLKELGQDLIKNKYENTGTLTLINGRRISIKGADRPDSLRGVGLSYVVLDEYAFMKEEVWEQIISPALARSEGGALFIGTPDGKNHFYELWSNGTNGKTGWKSWTYSSIDNPFLPSSEIAEAKERMSEELFRQEMEANFESGGGKYLSADMFSIVEEVPYPNDKYIAIDLAGFKKSDAGRTVKRLDDHAIAVVAVHAHGWCIENIIHGQWDTRETALRIVKAYRDYRPRRLGIEQGIAKDAVLPYLNDEQQRLSTFFNVEVLRHGNQRKEDRILWAIQGRAEKGRISLLRGDWNRTFLQQASDFPSTLSHDDLLDATAYIDQIADVWFNGPEIIEDWEPLDSYTGY